MKLFEILDDSRATEMKNFAQELVDNWIAHDKMNERNRKLLRNPATINYLLGQLKANRGATIPVGTFIKNLEGSSLPKDLIKSTKETISSLSSSKVLNARAIRSIVSLSLQYPHGKKEDDLIQQAVDLAGFTYDE